MEHSARREREREAENIYIYTGVFPSGGQASRSLVTDDKAGRDARVVVPVPREGMLAVLERGDRGRTQLEQGLARVEEVRRRARPPGVPFERAVQQCL
jgi:hypothetical protein